LLALDNALLSPHIASATTETRRAMTAVAVDNVLALFGHGAHAGHPPNLLNPEALAVGRAPFLTREEPTR
ncbi:glyoxylate reductase, partial [mine drainage metagenome]